MLQQIYRVNNELNFQTYCLEFQCAGCQIRSSENRLKCFTFIKLKKSQVSITKSNSCFPKIDIKTQNKISITH